MGEYCLKVGIVMCKVLMGWLILLVKVFIVLLFVFIMCFVVFRILCFLLVKDSVWVEWKNSDMFSLDFSCEIWWFMIEVDKLSFCFVVLKLLVFVMVIKIVNFLKLLIIFLKF